MSDARRREPRPATAPAPTGAVGGRPDDLLEVENVTKLFVTAPLFAPRSHAVALSRVSLKVPAGRCIGLVGESGSGKSTLVRCILGLETPDEGEIRFAGRKLVGGQRAARATRGEIQPIFQNPASSLNPRRRVGDIIAEPLAVHAGLSRAERRAEVRRLLDLVALPSDYARRYPGQLSGGQCQRVSIARALALKPKLIVADEATSALDVLVQRQIVDLLGRVCAEYGVAVLFVSHNLAVTRDLCDEIAVMYAGRIVEYGPSEAVVGEPAHPYTRSLVRSVPLLRPSADGAPVRPVPLPGEPPSPYDLPEGCPFSGRCPQALDICSDRKPAPIPAHGTGYAACHLLAPGFAPPGPAPLH